MSHMQSSIPFLSGSAYSDPAKKKHHMGQSFKYVNGYPIPIARGSTEEPESDGEEIYNPEMTFRRTSDKIGEGVQADCVDPFEAEAAAATLDKISLSFSAFYKESVPESSIETFRVCKVKLMVYLEDESVSVVEPRVENAGYPQGVLLRRQRVPTADGSRFLEPMDFNVGANITMYGRVYRINDCSEFTREYLSAHGVEVGAPEISPEDPYTNRRARMAQTKRPHRINPDREKLKRFLENDRKVLRFYIVWDDTTKLSKEDAAATGEDVFHNYRPLELHFFLVDDTVAIHEQHQANSGRDQVAAFMKRGRLPRSFKGLGDIHSQDYYCEGDFQIGQHVDVFGRKCYLYDCDAFTREFYRDIYGYDAAAMSAVVPRGVQQLPPARIAALREQLGEEAVGGPSCGGSTHATQLPVLVNLDGERVDEATVLKFNARLETKVPEDLDRAFVISYYPKDCSVLVFEPRRRNSGFIGGRLLERTAVTNPDTGSTFQPFEMFVGAHATIMSRTYIITGADNGSLSFMEANSQYWPLCDGPAVLESMRGDKDSVREALEAADRRGRGVVSENEFAAALNTHPQATLTLLRHYKDGSNPEVVYKQLLRDLGF